MVSVPCRLVRQEREMGVKRERFPPISFTRDTRSRGSAVTMRTAMDNYCALAQYALHEEHNSQDERGGA